MNFSHNSTTENIQYIDWNSVNFHWISEIFPDSKEYRFLLLGSTATKVRVHRPAKASSMAGNHPWADFAKNYALSQSEVSISLESAFI